MPWTTHGYWSGLREPIEPGPPRLDCGGPHRCMRCAVEAHQLEAEAVLDTTPTFDEPTQFSVEVTAAGDGPEVVTIRVRGVALDADSLSRSLSATVATALTAARGDTRP